MRHPRLHLLLSFALASLAVFGPTEAAEDGTRVRVHAEHRAGQVVYHYQIENRGRTELREIALGCDCRYWDGAVAPLLTVVPLGPQVGEPGYVGGDIALTPDVARTPPGWQANARRVPGSTSYWIIWHAVGGRGLPAGQTLKGFSLSVPRPDAALLTGLYTLPARRFVGTLEPLDATPPKLTLRAEETEPAAGEQALVRIVAQVDDDFDPTPQLALESFTPVTDLPPVDIRWSASATATRALRYRITYRATDASGNTTRSNIEVRVPADRGAAGVALPTALQLQALLP